MLTAGEKHDEERGGRQGWFLWLIVGSGFMFPHRNLAVVCHETAATKKGK
jgi:hypothetical protein